MTIQKKIALRRGLILILGFIILLFIFDDSNADDLCEIKLINKDKKHCYVICPGESRQIHCYIYHKHWVCEKDDILYWERRLESAAYMACGCERPSHIAPASPAISKKPKEKFIVFGN